MTAETIAFRPVEPGEIEDLALVMERANAQRDNVLPLPTLASSQSLEDVRVRVHRAEAYTHIAAHGRRIVGFALSHPLVDGEGGAVDTDHLALLMIDPDYWGRRIASRLLDFTVQRARDRGMHSLTLWTRATDNARAQEVYVHKGFVLTGNQKVNGQGKQVQYQLDLSK